MFFAPWLPWHRKKRCVGHIHWPLRFCLRKPHGNPQGFGWKTPWKSLRFWWVENWNHEIFLGHWTSSASKPSIPVPWAGAVAPARGLVGGMRNWQVCLRIWLLNDGVHEPYINPIFCWVHDFRVVLSFWMLNDLMDYLLSNTLRWLAESLLRVQSCLASFFLHIFSRASLDTFPKDHINCQGLQMKEPAIDLPLKLAANWCGWWVKDVASSQILNPKMLALFGPLLPFKQTKF